MHPNALMTTLSTHTFSGLRMPGGSLAILLVARYSSPFERSTAVPTIVFVHPDGSREAHRDAVGRTVMDCALDNGVRGIGAQCGGGCTCSTCHGFVDEAWFARVGGAVGDEADILEFTPGRRAASRLTCQIVIRDELDGLLVHVPPPE